MAGAAVIACGWRFAGAFAGGVANQPSVFGMTGAAVHLVGIPNWIGTGMAGVAIGAERGDLRVMVKGVFVRREAIGDVAMTLGAGVGGMALMAGSATTQGVDQICA